MWNRRSIFDKTVLLCHMPVMEKVSVTNLVAVLRGNNCFSWQIFSLFHGIGLIILILIRSNPSIIYDDLRTIIILKYWMQHPNLTEQTIYFPFCSEMKKVKMLTRKRLYLILTYYLTERGNKFRTCTVNVWVMSDHYFSVTAIMCTVSWLCVHYLWYAYFKQNERINYDFVFHPFSTVNSFILVHVNCILICWVQMTSILTFSDCQYFKNITSNVFLSNTISFIFQHVPSPKMSV